jgi:hypothetical protein
MALGLLLCTLVGSLLSLRISTIPVSEVAIGIGFFGGLLLFATVMFGGAVRYLKPRLRSLPLVVTGAAVVSVIVTAIICVSSLDRMGAGSPEEIGGRYFLINHGERTEVTRSGYTAALAANIRFMAVIACVFLGVGAVASGNRRHMLENSFDAEDDE